MHMGKLDGTVGESNPGHTESVRRDGTEALFAGDDVIMGTETLIAAEAADQSMVR